MESIFADTNALIRLLENDKVAIELLDRKMVFISEMTEMEMLCYSNMTKESRKIVQAMLNDCVIVPFSPDIKQRAIKIRLITRMKLVDSIIAATAVGLDIPIITRDRAFESLSKSLNVILLT
jgi:predicted nucleic acid-binding protein